MDPLRDDLRDAAEAVVRAWGEGIVPGGDRYCIECGSRVALDQPVPHSEFCGFGKLREAIDAERAAVRASA